MTINFECVDWSTDTIVSTGENGRKANFRNPGRDVVEKISVDNCVMKQVTASDKVISKRGEGDVIVEFKGGDIKKAIEQVRATATHWNKNRYREGKLAALIVGTHVPNINSSIQVAMAKFKKDFNAPLHVVTKNYEYEFGNLFSFKGPLKS